MGSVADNGTTVLLSSHLLADLERVCDYLILLQTAQVQVLGSVEDLLAGHKAAGRPASLGAAHRRAWRPWSGPAIPTSSPPCSSAPTGRSTIRPGPSTVSRLEDLVLAYLADPSVGALPGPAPLGVDRGGRTP